MPKFRFPITAPATMTAEVTVEAETLEEAQEIALRPSFYEDPEKADFKLDDCNIIEEVYLPDPDQFEIVDESPKP